MTRIKRALVAASLLATLSGCAGLPGERIRLDPKPERPRVIVTTDGEIDDQSSMVRFLTYASDFDVAGIVQVNSNAQRHGHSDEKWIEAQIDAYDRHLPVLRIHDRRYPAADQLRRVLVVGNERSEDFGRSPDQIADSAGAQLIIKTLLDDDPRPVHILAWGGANTQANALWQIKTRYSRADYLRAAAKARLYCIWFQDKAGEWIVENLPEVTIYGAGRPDRDGSWRDVWDYRSVNGKRGNIRDSANPLSVQAVMGDDWMAQNIKSGHGALGAMYPQSYTSEGDTPAFLPLVDNGLEQDRDYTWGGWGGRAVRAKAAYLEDGADDNQGRADRHYTFWRWLPEIQNDWAARSDWFVAKRYQDANHPPAPRLTGPRALSARPGSVVALNASPSRDPDGDALSFRWWQYHEADSVEARIAFMPSTAPDQARFVVPNEPGRQVHVILEVTDNGAPALTRYQRVIVTIDPSARS